MSPHLAVGCAMQYHRAASALIGHVASMRGPVDIGGQVDAVSHGHHVVLHNDVLVGVILIDQGGVNHRDD